MKEPPNQSLQLIAASRRLLSLIVNPCYSYRRGAHFIYHSNSSCVASLLGASPTPHTWGHEL